MLITRSPCWQGGLRKLLGLLHTTLHALRRAEGGEVRAERQLGYHIADTLSHYFRTHLVLHLTGLQRRLAPAPGSKQVPLLRCHTCSALARWRLRGLRLSLAFRFMFAVT